MSYSDCGRIASTRVTSCADIHQQGMLEWEAGSSEVHARLNFSYLRTCLWQFYRNGSLHCCSHRSYQPSYLNTFEK